MCWRCSAVRSCRAIAAAAPGIWASGGRSRSCCPKSVTGWRWYSAYSRISPTHWWCRPNDKLHRAIALPIPDRSAPEQAMSSDAELAAWLRLSLVPGLGPKGQRKLLKAFGLPTQIYAAGRAALGKQVGEELARRIVEHHPERDIEAALQWATQPSHHIVTLAAASYPAMLLEIPAPPTLLYASGAVELLNRPMLAVVGSRNATAQGLSNA